MLDEKVGLILTSVLRARKSHFFQTFELFRITTSAVLTGLKPERNTLGVRFASSWLETKNRKTVKDFSSNCNAVRPKLWLSCESTLSNKSETL